MTQQGSADQNRMIGFAGRFALGLLIALAFLHLPIPPPAHPGLDASWQLCLSYLFQQGRQFGADIVFTFGPLGFVMSSTYCGTGFWLQLAATAAVCAMFSWILLETIRPLKWPLQIIAALAVILLIGHAPTILYLLMIVLAGLLLLRDEKPGLLNIVLCCISLGFLSLTKFTDFLLAVAVVAVAASYYLLAGNWRRALLVAGGFAISCSAWWIICRQSPSTLIGYVTNSLAISNGFEDAMASYERPHAFLLGIITLLLIVTYGAFEALAAKCRLKSLALVLIYCLATYLTWKHAFIRADGGHMTGLYLWAFVPIVFNTVLFPGGARWRIPRYILLTAIALCSLIGLYRLDPGLLKTCIPSAIADLRENLSAVANLPRFKRDLDSAYAAVAQAGAAPRIVQAVGRDSVDVFGFEQGIAILNRLNYTPRPVFQSYCVYTQKLAALNAAFIAGDHAPDWILQRYQTADHRYPSADDGPALRVLLNRYTYRFEDSGYLVWRRTSTDTLTPLPSSIREGDAPFDQDIPLDIPPGSSVWLEVDYNPTLLGSLRSLFYKPPLVNIRVLPSDFRAVPPDFHSLPEKFRFPRLLAREGMLLSPYIETQSDFLKYATGQPLPVIQTFRLQHDRKDARYLKRTFHYRLRILPPPLSRAAPAIAPPSPPTHPAAASHPIPVPTPAAS